MAERTHGTPGKGLPGINSDFQDVKSSLYRDSIESLARIAGVSSDICS